MNEHHQTIDNEFSLGQAIRQERLRQGLTQAQLAQKAQVSRAFVIGLEQATRPRAELMRVFQVLRALNLALSFEHSETLSFNQALERALGRP
jgi:HTH-type transcriptional regulator/antitoxin HipB